MKHFTEVEYKTIEERDAEREALLLEKQGWEKEIKNLWGEIITLKKDNFFAREKYDKLLDVASILLANCTDTTTEVWRKILEERVKRV